MAPSLRVSSLLVFFSCLSLALAEKVTPVIGEWSLCSRVDEKCLKTRLVLCATSSGTVVDSSLCEDLPESMEVCETCEEANSDLPSDQTVSSVVASRNADAMNGVQTELAANRIAHLGAKGSNKRDVTTPRVEELGSSSFTVLAIGVGAVMSFWVVLIFVLCQYRHYARSASVSDGMKTVNGDGMDTKVLEEDPFINPFRSAAKRMKALKKVPGAFSDHPSAMCGTYSESELVAFKL